MFTGSGVDEDESELLLETLSDQHFSGCKGEKELGEVRAKGLLG
jgi:hypothetical protein